MYKRRYKKASSRIAKRGRLERVLKVSLFVILPVTAFVAVVFVLRSSFLQIKNVEVSGNMEISKEEIETLAKNSLSGTYFSLIPKSNILFFGEDKLSDQILESQKRAEEVDISTDSSGNLKIELKERKGMYLWCLSTERCFLMSGSGLIFAEAKPEEMLGKLVFVGGIEGNPEMQNFADSKTMENYIKAYRRLTDGNLAVGRVTLESLDRAVFKTNKGGVILNPEEDMTLGAENALLLIKDANERNPQFKFEYIDARFGKKLFYKPELPN